MAKKKSGVMSYEEYQDKYGDIKKGPVSYDRYQAIKTEQENEKIKQQRIAQAIQTGAPKTVQRIREKMNPLTKDNTRWQAENARNAFGYGKQYTVDNGHLKVNKEANPQKREFVEWLGSLNKKTDKATAKKNQALARSAVLRNPEEIKTDYQTRKMEEYRKALAEQGLTFDAVEASRKANKTGNNWTIQQQVDLDRKNAENAKKRLLDDAGLPFYMSESARKALRDESEKTAQEKRALAEQYGQFIPEAGTAGLYDYVYGLDVQNEKNILNNPAYKGTAYESNANAQLAQLNNDYNQNRRNVETLTDRAMADWKDPRELEGYDAEQARAAIYDSIMPDSYKERIKGMSYEQKKALDDEIDKAYAGTQMPWGEGSQADAVDSLNREASAWEAQVKAIDEAQSFYDFIQRERAFSKDEWMADVSPTYDPSLHPEARMEYNAVIGQDVMTPQGNEIEKAYWYANNWQNMGGMEDKLTYAGKLEYVNKYMFLGADPEILEMFNQYYAKDKKNGSRGALGSNLTEQFLKGLDPYLTTLMTQYQDNLMQSTAQDPVKGTALRLISPALQAVGGITGTIGAIAGQDIDSGLYLPSRVVAQTRSRQNEDISKLAREAFGDFGGDAAQFLLGVADSVADNVFAMGVGTALGGEGTTKAIRLVQAIMSGSATSNKMIEMLQNGTDKTEAALYAIGDGVIEWLTEKYSLEQIMGPDVKQLLGNKKAIASFIARSGIAEGSEEINSGLLNMSLDYILSMVYDHEDELKQKYNELVTRYGMTDEQASSKVIEDKLRELGLEGLAGAISGEMMAGSRVITNSFNNRTTGKKVKAGQGGADLMLDIAKGMTEGTESRSLAEELARQQEAGKEISDNDLGRLAKMTQLESSEEIESKSTEALKNQILQELEGKNLQGVNKEEAADAILKAVQNGGTQALNKAERSVIMKNAVMNVYKNYLGVTKQSTRAVGAQLDATEYARKAQQSLSDLFSNKQKTVNTGDRVVHGATAEDIRMAESVSNHIQAGTEVLLDGKFAKLEGVEVTKDKEGKYELKAIVDGKAVPAAAIKATGAAVGRILGEASISPEFFSRQFVQTLLDAQLQGQLKDAERGLNEAKQIRMYAYMGMQMPQTSLDFKLASKIYKESAEEHGQNRKAQAAEGNRLEKGRVTYDGVEYGTDEWKQKVKGLGKTERNQMDAIAGIAQRAGIEVDFTDLNDSKVYGSESKSGIRINIAGLNYGALNGEATGKHNMVVTFGHEMTHWLQRNSMAGYNRLERFVMQQYAENQGTNALTNRINHHMYQWGLSLEDAMSEIVADSCDQILADEQVMQHIENTDHKLFTEVKNFVSNLVDRIRQAVKSMPESASKDARALAKSANEIAKVWLGAYDEALTGVAAEETEAVPAEAMRLSRAETDTEEDTQIKKQVNSHLEQLNAMEPVASITSNVDLTRYYENGARSVNAAIKAWAVEILKGGADREGFGHVEITSQGIKKGLGYISNIKEKAAFAAVKDVIEKGDEINYHKAHKGGQADSHTFAAKIRMDGDPKLMAVVVRYSDDINRYKAHKLYMPDGTVVEMDKNNETEMATMPTGEPANTHNSVSTESIAQDEAESNTRQSRAETDKNIEGFSAGSMVDDIDNMEQVESPSTPEIINSMTNLVKLDQEYEEAATRGDIKKTTEMLLNKLAETQGVIPFIAPEWDAGEARETAKLLKVADPEAIATAADKMSDYVPDNAVLIPMPGREGKVTADSWSVKLAEAISERTGRPVVIALEGEERESRQAAKHKGEQGASQEELGFRKVADIPEGTFPIFIDNVVGKGVTADAARQAIGGGITLAYTKTLRSPGIIGLKNLVVTHESQKNGGGLIPLSERLNVEKRDVRYSRSEESYDVEAWLGNMTPGGLQTEDERILMETFKGLRVSMSLCLHKQVLYQNRIKELQKKTVLDADAKHELESLQQKLQGQKWRMEQLEKEMAEVTSSEGYAGMMYKHNMLFKDFVNGQTQEQVNEKADQLMAQVKAANKEIEKQRGELRKLAQTQAVKTMQSYLGKTSLERMTDVIRKTYSSNLSREEVRDRLAFMALKLADGQDIKADAESLAWDLRDQLRGLRDDNLDYLRGTTFIIGESLARELRAENSSVGEQNEKLRGSGVRLKVNTYDETGRVADSRSQLVSQWEELRQKNGSLPEFGPSDIDVLHGIVDMISKGMQDAKESSQAQMNLEDAVAMIYASAASINTYFVEDAEAKKQIRNLMNQIKDLSNKTGDIESDMEKLEAQLNEALLTAAKVKGWSEALQTDMRQAIDYYNKTAAVAAKTERQKVKEGLIKQLRSENTKKLIEQQEKYREMMRSDKEARETVQTIQGERYKINTNIKRIKNLLTAETDQKNIPEEAKGLARMMSRMLVQHDQSAERHVLLADNKQLADFAERLDRMEAAYGPVNPEEALDFLVIKAPNAEDNDYTLRDKAWQDLVDIEAGLLEYRTAEGLGKQSLKDRAAALKKIQEAVSELTTVIKRRGEAFINGKRYETAALAEQMENEMQGSRFKGERRGRGSGAKDAVERALRYGNLTPEYYIKNLHNGVLSLLWEGFHDAEQDSGLEGQNAKERMEQIAEETGFASWDGQEKHTIKVNGGREIRITTEQLMALYATWLREKNQMRPEKTAHLLQGGFVLTETDTNKGKARREIIEQRPIRMKAEQLDALANELTENQRAYVNAVVAYMSGELAELGNKASMDAYGIRKFTEQYYFPIKSWGGVLSQKSDRGVANKNDNRAMRQSFSKRVQANAQNAIEISDFTPTAVKHIVGMITYNTVGPAVENLNKVLNQQLTYGEQVRDESGEVTEDNTYKVNMAAAFQQHYGKAAYDYLVQFMKDVNGGITQRNESSLRESLLTLFKKNAVAGSLSVAAQQPLSYIRAAMMVNPKYLAEALNPKYWKGSYAEMMKYSGVAVIKAMGKFDMNYGRSMIDYITPEGMQKNKAKAAYEWFSEKSTKLPEKMDAMTWTRMWTAVKLQLAAENKGADMKSEAFLKQAAVRFNELMRRTQVYDSVMVKSQNMRSDKYLKKVATSFMAEPTLTLNVLADAWMNIKAEGGKKQAVKALVTFLLSAAAQAGAKAFFGAGRSPDKKKTRRENFYNKFAYNLLSEANPLGLIPGYNQLMSVLQDGELKDDAMGVIGKAVESVDKIFQLATGNGKGTYRDLEDSIGQMVQYATNIPAKNFMRDFRAMVNWFSGGTAQGFTGDSYAQRDTSAVVMKYQLLDNLMNSDLIGLINSRLGEAGYDTTAAGYVQRLYNAQKAGDKKRAEDMNEYLTLAFGKKQDKINSQLNTLAKADESTSPEEKQKLLQENEYGSLSSWVLEEYKKGEINRKTAEKMYREERPKATDKDVLEALDKIDYEKRTGKKVESYSNYTPLYDAIDENRTEKIREALKYMMENGYKKEDIKRQLTTKYKQAYLDADAEGKRKIRDAIQKTYKAMGYTATDADKIINGWKNEKKKK